MKEDDSSNALDAQQLLNEKAEELLAQRRYDMKVSLAGLAELSWMLRFSFWLGPLVWGCVYAGAKLLSIANVNIILVYANICQFVLAGWGLYASICSHERLKVLPLGSIYAIYFGILFIVYGGILVTLLYMQR